MAKISVRHGVAHAYGLFFGRPLTVIGLTWLPAVFYAIGAAYLIQHMNAAMALAVPSSGGLLGQYAFFYFAVLVVTTAFFGAVIAVPLTRQALGLHEGPAAAHLVVGGREFRLFLALLRYYAIVVCALVVLAVAAGVAISQGTHFAEAHGVPAFWQGIALETWLNSVAGTLAVVLFVILAVRYGFFLDAVGAVEDHAKLARAARLARGNFWSIATTLFVVAVPASAVLVACEMTFGGLSMSGTGIAPTHEAYFAGILSAGLVVLHALLAGASAGAYSELAEAVEDDDAATEHAPSGFAEPAFGFAHAAAFAAAQPAPAAESSAFQSVPLSPPAIATMEVATPEAESAAPPAVPVAWMAPPPDAHFGSDPHDTHNHESPPLEAVAPSGPEEPASAAVHSAETASAIAPEGVKPDVQPAAIAAVAMDAPPTPIAAPDESASEPNGNADRPPAPETQTAALEVPEHASIEELPAPPLDPVGAIAAQSELQMSE